MKISLSLEKGAELTASYLYPPKDIKQVIMVESLFPTAWPTLDWWETSEQASVTGRALSCGFRSVGLLRVTARYRVLRAAFSTGFLLCFSGQSSQEMVPGFFVGTFHPPPVPGDTFSSWSSASERSTSSMKSSSEQCGCLNLLVYVM